jgi:hypothetical protein
MAIYINREAPESGIASLLAMQGTRGDTELVHMTKPEVKSLASTGLMSLNNTTGLPEFGLGSSLSKIFKSDLMKTLLPIAAGVAFPALLGPALAGGLGIGSTAAGALAGGLGTTVGGLATGQDAEKAITSGLLSGGLSYGLGSAFPETFGLGEKAAGVATDAPKDLLPSEAWRAIDPPLDQAGAELAKTSTVAQDLIPTSEQFMDTVLSEKSILPAVSSFGGAALGGMYDEEYKPTEFPQRPGYERQPVEYKYDLLEEGPLKGLTPRQIRKQLEKGGVGKFYGPSEGSEVFTETISTPSSSPVSAITPHYLGQKLNIMAAEGGLIGLAEGGSPAFEGQIPGEGHGMQDNVLMPINDRGGIAAVSPDEYVVPADVMSMIGNGSADNGAKAMDDFIADFRTIKYGRPEQPPQTNPRGALQSLMRT